MFLEDFHFLLLISFFLLFVSYLPTTSEAATVSVEWSGVQSSYFDDDPIEEEGEGRCQYANADSPILLGHPMSIDVHDTHYVLGITMLKAAQMTIDKINMFPRCGLTLRDGLNYSMALQTYGDESSKPKTARIASKLAQDPSVDFMLAGYSSSLTSFVTPYAQNHSKLCLTGGSSRTSVHADRPYVFGLNPPSKAYLENAFVGTAAQGAKTVAYLAEDTASACDGVNDMATKYNMTVLNATIILEESSLDLYEQVAQDMKTIYNPDLMITCVRTRSSFWNLAMRQVDWVPKAQVYTYVVGTNEFENLLGPTDLPYTMGVSSWDSAIPPIPDVASGWTPLEFDVLFEEATLGRPASYQQVQQSAVVSVLVQAIERIGWYQGPEVMDQIRHELATGFFPTVYGNVSFDVNGQNAVPFLLLQYDHNSTVHVLLPEEKHFTDFDLYYPLPTWSQRDCLFESTCLATGGDCTTNGTCSNCPSPLLSEGIASTATCVVPPEQQIIIVKEGSTKTTMLAIVIPLVLLILIGAILFVYWQKLKQNNDKIWKVDAKELIFAEPTPEIIGRGSFGLVLKAEFRGTSVAVKRALPPKPDPDDNSSNKTGGGGTGRRYSASGGMKKRISNNSRHSNSTRSSIFYDTGGPPNIMNNPDLQEPTSDDLSDIPTARDSSSSHGGMGGGGDGPAMRKSMGLNSAAIFSNNDINTPPTTSAKLSESKLREQFIKEMRVLSRLRHPCITTVMGAVISSKPGTEPMLIMEYMDHGSLQDILHNETMFVENDMLLSILIDIASGCRFLHAANPQVIHCDLKAGNILVDSRFRAKVSDFGLSQKQHNHAAGTPFWMAPELLRNDSLNTTESDVYSFGILLYEVLSRKDPYYDEPDDDESVMSLLREIADPVINKRPPVPPGSPPQLGSMMCDCIVAKPEDRPSFEELHKRIQRIDIRQMDEATNNPAAAKSRTSVSLFDIFPKHVAEALRDGKEIEPEHKDNVTIFFSDIVGFTTISQELDPRKVARMLDRFYLKLDTLSQVHDVFKVETIGDAYMAVSNLVKDQHEDHASRIAQFSVDAIEAANQTLIDEDDPDRGYLSIRCGFHSGPVVADVVGSRNPRYCLFGDTVNTASRMESNSVKDQIHCSKTAARQLKKEKCPLPISSRGVIKVKGKGKMETFWINLTTGEPGEEGYVQPRRASTLNLDLPALEEALDESKTENGELSFSTPSQTFSNPSGELFHHSKTVRRMSGLSVRSSQGSISLRGSLQSSPSLRGSTQGSLSLRGSTQGSLSLRGSLQDSKPPDESLLGEHWHDEDTSAPLPSPTTKVLNQKKNTWLRLHEEVVQLDDELSV